MTRWPPLIQFLLISGGIHLLLLVSGVLSTTPTGPTDNRVGDHLRATLVSTARPAMIASPADVDAAHTSAESIPPSDSIPTPPKAPDAETRSTAQAQPLRSSQGPVKEQQQQPEKVFPPIKTTETFQQADVTKIKAERKDNVVETATLDDASTTAAVSQAPSAEQIAQWQSRLQAQLTEHMQSQFRYPLMARRRGWQGVVRLRFVVTNRGQITGVELAGSSGYQLLDDSALRSAARIQEIPLAFEAANSIAPLRVEIPVRFLLRG